MTIKFGNESVEKYKQNQDLIDCIPSDDFHDWVKIVPEKRKIEIRLK